MLSETLVELIKSKQEKEGFNQQQMADYLGVAYRTFQEILSTGNIAKTETLLHVANRLGVTITLNSAQNITATVEPSQEKAVHNEVIDYIKDRIEPSLTSISDNVLYGRAEVRAKIEYDALKDAKGDFQKKEAIMEQINKLIGFQLTGG